MSNDPYKVHKTIFLYETAMNVVFSAATLCEQMLNQWFPNCAPQRPREPWPLHRGATEYCKSFIIN
jgi:hypothetical protein